MCLSGHYALMEIFMTKRMLIDDTQPEETRVVVVNGNKLEDVEFESSNRKQIKGNIYLGKIMRVEPSLQACFVDYGGNKHGFMAFGEIHPDYYNVTDEVVAEIEKEVDEIIENKKRIIKERELERERRALEKAKAREEALKAKAEAEAKALEEAQNNAENQNENSEETVEKTVTEATVQEPACETANTEEVKEAETVEEVATISEEEFIAEEEAKEEESGKRKTKRRVLKKKFRKKYSSEENKEQTDEVKVLAEDSGLEEEKISQEVSENSEAEAESLQNEHDDDDEDEAQDKYNDNDEALDDDDDDEDNLDFELQRKLIKSRKLYHRHKIQDVIKEGQTVLVQVVKEERGNKGAALTTYLSLAGRYCVLMPNRIKSGGVSRKITNASDRNRLKGIVKELPLNPDMSIIVRTAGEEKTKGEIVRDYNYLIRSWNKIRLDSLKNKAPKMIYEEGNLIKRALRDIYTKEISEILVAGDDAYKLAKDFFKILSPHNLKKIKSYRNNDMPLFQRFQVEGQLDKLHDSNAQLESGGYLVINPTEALVSIDVNSGRATKEKDLEETALKTNLEACDEIARQLRLRNLAGLVVIDFIDMDEPANNHAVEKRMKEALKKDRSRIQVGKMSIFGLLELSRQRMHSAFWESNYQVCPYCHGKGITRTLESAGTYILRNIEEEGCKNRSSKITIFLPTDIAVYLLNQKRKTLVDLENKYKMEIAICADNSIKCVSDYRIDRVKSVTKEEKPTVEEPKKEEVKVTEQKVEPDKNTEEASDNLSQQDVTNEESGEEKGTKNDKDFKNRRNRRGRFDRRRNRYQKNSDFAQEEVKEEKQEAVILYDSHGEQNDSTNSDDKDTKKGKSNWWKKLIKG
ncbi:MAG: Rne/Rng family ribonuclease [Alphaproteobacteria bacterium]|nr:Rne/Rng family ribonuclease [Alphaproteobacteria bacterium]